MPRMHKDLYPGGITKINEGADIRWSEITIMIELEVNKMDELFEKLATMLAADFHITREQISMGSKLYEELGIDRSCLLELADRVDGKFQVFTDLNEFLTCKCVGDIVAIIYNTQLLKEKKNA
jgi:acyl carrier protein